MFNPEEPKFARGMLCQLPYPTDDTRIIVQAALAGLEAIYRPGYAFAKAEILLVDLCQRGEFTDDLFASTQPAGSDSVMKVLDSINLRWGRGTLRPGVVPATPVWGMKQQLLSQSYTTRVDQLWSVPAR
jgi:DNA polymerase V